MKRRTQKEYEVILSGTPDYSIIPKAVLEPIAQKFLENILKQSKKKGD